MAGGPWRRRRLLAAAAAAGLAPWAAARLALPPDAAWQRVVARGHLVVGVPVWLPPFGAPSRAGPWVGLDVALARGLALAVFGSVHRVQLRPLGPEERLWAVRAGLVDAAAAGFAAPLPGPAGARPGPPRAPAAPHADDAPAPAGWTDLTLAGPYFHDALALLARGGMRLRTLRALDGRPVGVLPGGRGAAALRRAMRGVGQPVVAEVGGAPEGLRQLAAGALVALVAARAVLDALALYDPALAVYPVPALGREAFWLLLPAGAVRLAAAARRAIQGLPQGGELRALLRAWSLAAADPWAPPPAAPAPSRPASGARG